MRSHTHALAHAINPQGVRFIAHAKQHYNNKITVKDQSISEELCFYLHCFKTLCFIVCHSSGYSVIISRTISDISLIHCMNAPCWLGFELQKCFSEWKRFKSVLKSYDCVLKSYDILVIQKRIARAECFRRVICRTPTFCSLRALTL